MLTGNDEFFSRRARALAKTKPGELKWLTTCRDFCFGGFAAVLGLHKLKGLILAQNERWRRGLGMQVEREPRKGGQRRKGQ